MNNKIYNWNKQKYSLSELLALGFHPIKYTGSIFQDDNLTYLEKNEGKWLYRLVLSDKDYLKCKNYLSTVNSSKRGI